MADIAYLSRLINGYARNVDLQTNTPVVLSIKIGGASNTELTKTILDSLIANSHASGSDNQTITAGAGLTGGGSGASVTLDVGAGSGITVNANDIAVDSTVIRTTGANAFGADQSMGGFKLTNVATPVSGTDAANKAYVDAVQQGLDVKSSVRVATTANITLSGAQTIDGISVIAGDRVLVKNQTTGSENGLYVCAAGAWSRSTDADISAEVTPGMFCFIEEGTANADSGWILITDAPITLGTTALVFSQFSGAGSITAGAGLTKTGNTLDVIAADTSITVNADSVQVNLNAAGALEVSSGLKVKLEASNPSLQISSNELGIKFDGAGALSKGASGTKANVDGSTIEIATNALQVKAGGILNAHIGAAAAIAYSKLSLTGSVVNADISASAAIAYSKLSLTGSIVNADISASAAIVYSKLSLSNSIVTADIVDANITAAKLASDSVTTVKILDANVTLAKLASNSVDQNKIVSTALGSTLSGGSGTVLGVVSSPLSKKTMVAGEAMAANTSFVVRFAINSETASRVYKSDQDATTLEKFYAVGICLKTSSVIAGDNVDMIFSGSHTLGSSDTAFNAVDIGKPVFLTSSGAFSITAPTTTNYAVVRIGIVESVSSIWITPPQVIGIN